MQTELQKIVNTWKIKIGAEYRIYRCAKCQKPIRKAYQYLLNSKEFGAIVHLCKNCNKLYNFSKTKFNNFKCDNCSKIFFKSWHIWDKKKNKRIEKHLCRNCFIRS